MKDWYINLELEARERCDMSIYIDSADITQIKTALDLGWVKGITTNPLLLAQSEQDAATSLQRLKDLSDGPIFYQLLSESFEEALSEAHQAVEILEKQLVVKLPPTDLGFKLCAELSSRMACCPTAIYSPAQALIAREAGAQYLAVYVNRATRLLGDGLQLVRDIATVLENSPTRLLAASLKSPGEAVNAFSAGADDLTLPFSTLMDMTKHPLSEDAIDQFQSEGKGLDQT